MATEIQTRTGKTSVVETKRMATLAEREAASGKVKVPILLAPVWRVHTSSMIRGDISMPHVDTVDSRMSAA
jgi:hypothetical protein